MREYLKFYIDGTWVDPVRPNTLEVDNPTTLGHTALTVVQYFRTQSILLTLTFCGL